MNIGGSKSFSGVNINAGLSLNIKGKVVLDIMKTASVPRADVLRTDLNSEGCDVLSLVDVVVQSGGEGEEAVGGDEQLRHQVPVERK